MKVLIGIPIQAEPQRLFATLETVRASTALEYELLLLPDGPDEATRQALLSLRDVPQRGTDEARGAPACFNRLVAGRDADVFVLLESGALVSPGWLDRMVAALLADPRNGLAGPSTNLAWNEQSAFPRRDGSAPDIERTAAEAARRFERETRVLAPLYSLADFCYAVRREVVDEIGLADESYGLGPCWEMDYNVRAERAGWRGVWACSAYVYRPPFTQRRALDERRLFEANKRRYQDKFCGARLRGQKLDFRPHCRGDACPNFAPTRLIPIKLPLASAEIPPVEAQPPASDASDITVSDPLVSCIMPTYNRRQFIPGSIQCFLAQDYPNCELLIVDDGTDAIADLVPADARIRYLRLEQKMTLGAKRNFACTEARGAFIAHWDDDDWYPAWRVRRQLRALLERQADVCGSSWLFYFDRQRNQAWEYRYGASGPPWVAGNTLAFRKSFWQRNKFLEIQIGEDTRFLWSTTQKKVVDLRNAELCVASVHSGNTSRKHTAGSYWHLCPAQRVDTLMQASPVPSPAAPSTATTGTLPLVSCIMPTWNRRAFLRLSLRHFLQQTYSHRELIVVDDGDDAVVDLFEGCASVRYIRLSQRASIGAKRNLACQHCAGEIIAHWDDDDWYAPERLAYQVRPILDGLADITGLENAFTLELPEGQFWTADTDLHKRLFIGDVHGGTLVYRRELLAQGLRYPEVNLAEDAGLLQSALRQGKRLLRLENRGLFVYVRHGRNAWKQMVPGKVLKPAGWKRTGSPDAFQGDTLQSYRAALRG